MPFSILSLDGGGTWALIQVRVLQQLYGRDAKGHDILRNFDLVIANSGGSLVLSAMCMNKPLETIAEMFLDPKILQTIFVKRLFNYYFPGVKKFTPRFKTSEKIKGLEKQLVNEGEGLNGHMLLPELAQKISPGKKLQLVITCFDYDKNRAVYFRSDATSRMETANIEKELGLEPTDKFKTVSLLHAAHGSSNAPVLFFDDPAEFSYDSDDDKTIRRFWDGAVGGNNNPVAAGVLEALANGAKKEDLRILSIGTANTLYPVMYGSNGEPKYDRDWLVKPAKDEGLIGDLEKMTQSIVSDPPDAASFIAQQLLGTEFKKPNPQFIRINPLVKPILNENTNSWEKPGKGWSDDDLETLFTMDMAVTDEDRVKLIDRLCTDFFNDSFDNQGIRTGGKKLDAILGHKKFSQAKSDWEKWSASNNPG